METKIERTAERSFDRLTPANPVVNSFLACLQNARRETSPFDYWLLTNPFPDGVCDELVDLPFAPPGGAVFSGKRETNNSSRVYFTPANQVKYDACRRLAQAFQDASVRSGIEQTTGADLSDGHLRIEYCQDTDGFWLEPHTDILVKKFTMVVYLSDDANLVTAGTDVYEGPPDFKLAASAPYAKNSGIMFVPGRNTWHGVARRPIKGVRKSIIVNYVTSAWRDAWELA